MSDEPARPVWLNHDRRRVLHFAAEFLRAKGFEHDAADLERIVAEWDAAPPDTAEAVLEAVKAELQRAYASSKRMSMATWITTAVLVALGYPDTKGDT